MRTFRVDRILQATPADNSFALPRDFSVRDYMARTMRFETPYQVVVHAAADIVPQVRERHSHWMEIAGHPDGSATLRFAVANLDWASGWVLSQGEAVRVIAPPELIARIKEVAAGVLQRYGEGKAEV